MDSRKEKNDLKLGFNSYQLKLSALIAMTLDHIGTIFPYDALEQIIIKPNLLRIIGRIAAPLFLYVLTSSLHYTKNKGKLIVRIYLANLMTGFFISLMNFTFGDIIGVHATNNIFSTYFCVVLYAFLIENICIVLQQHMWKKFLLLAMLFLIVLYVPMIVHKLLYNQNILFAFFSNIHRDWISLLFPYVRTVDFSPFFVALGVLWYFTPSKIGQTLELIVFSMISRIGTELPVYINVPFIDFFSDIQFWMVLTIPFILLYNKKRGKERKCFFYLYYPLHQFVLMFVANFIN